MMNLTSSIATNQGSSPTSVGLRLSPTGLGLVGLVVLACLYWFQHALGYWEDDSFIHLEYARSVFEGQGFVFNGVLSNGDTAPLWVLLLAGARHLVPDWLLAGKALAALGTVFALLMQFAYCRRLQADLGSDAQDQPAWVLALFVLNPYFVYWAYSGMEALAASGLLMLLCLLVTRPTATPLSFLGSAFLLGLSPLVRPEMVLLIGICGPFLLWQWWKLVEGKTGPQRMAWFLGAAVLLALPLACWTLYALDAFGYVMPNTNAAKRAPPGTSAAWRMLMVYGMGFPGVMLSLAALAVLALRKRAVGALPRHTSLPMAAWPLLAYVVVTSLFYMVNHTYVQTRYVMVVAPGLSVLCYVMLRHMGGRTLHAVVLGVAAAAALFITVQQAHPLVRNKAEKVEQIERMSVYINANLPADAKIAVYAIGQFGYLVRNELVDVGGITQPEAAQYLWAPPEQMLAWAKRQGATYYLEGGAPEPGAELVHEIDASSIGWSMAPGYYDRKGKLRLWKLAPP